MRLWPVDNISWSSATDSSSRSSRSRRRTRLGSARTFRDFSIDAKGYLNDNISTYLDLLISGETFEHSNVRQTEDRQRLQGRRHETGRVGPQRDYGRRAGDARLDV